MYRLVIAVLLLTASVASADALTLQTAEWEQLTFIVTATDAFSSATDAIHSRRNAPINLADVQHSFVNTGVIQGSVNPAILYTADVRVDTSDVLDTFKPTSHVSNRDSQLVFDLIEIVLQYSALRVPGTGGQNAPEVSSARLMGDWLFGEDTIPFDITFEDLASQNRLQISTARPDRMVVEGVLVTDLPSFQVGDITYSAHLRMDPEIVIPEPTPALLVWAGLLCMGLVGNNQNRTRPWRRR